MSGARGRGVQDPAMMWCLEGVFWDFEHRWRDFWSKLSHLILFTYNLNQLGNMFNRVGTFTPNPDFVGYYSMIWHAWKEEATHTCAQVYKHNKAAKSLTITLLSILRDSEARLTDHTFKGTLCVCTCSLGACSGQCTLINIWRETTHTVRHSLQYWNVSTAKKKKDPNSWRKARSILTTSVGSMGLNLRYM